MVDESNPAGRLHKILSEAKGIPDQKSVIEGWSTVLGVKVNSIIVTKGVIELDNLSQEIQTLIKTNNKLNHRLYLSSFDQIEKSFFPLNLQSNWSTVKQHLTDEALTRLQFCAEELTGFYSEESLSKEDLEDIIVITEQLFEALNNSSLPDALRLGLLEETERIRHAISLYKIKGAKGLKEALQATIGFVIVNQEELKSHSKANFEIVKRIGELIDKLDSFTSRALKLKCALTKPIRFLLGKVTDPEEENENDDA